MNLSRPDLDAAVQAGILTRQQADALWARLDARAAERPRFDLPHVAYYFGALLVIGAMAWYVTRRWDYFTGIELAGVAVAYATAFTLAGRTLWNRPGMRIPGGLLFTIAVMMTPMAVYGIERATGLWGTGVNMRYLDRWPDWTRLNWIIMELATVGAGLLALRKWRFPFLTAPVAVALWLIALDIAPLSMGQASIDYDQQATITACFGLVVLLGAYFVDLRNRAGEDFSFWFYLFGLLAFWGGLTLMRSDSEWSKLFYCVINLSLIAKSLVLRHRAFLVFGTLGVAGYLGHLAWRVFQDSIVFPFALSAIGIAIIGVGVWFQKNRGRVDAWIERTLPPWMKELLPPRVRGAA